MKKIFFISLLAAIVALQTACDDQVTYGQEEYQSVVYLKESGLVDIVFYNVDQDVSYKTAVCRGGTNPALTGEVTLVPFTAEELNDYNTDHGTTYEMLPVNCYTVTNKVSFEPNQEYAPVEVILKKETGNLRGSYILPIHILSDDHSVNSFSGTLILRPEIIVPMVSLEHAGAQLVQLGVADDPKVFTTNLLFDFINEWNFTAKLIDDQAKLQELVDKYNTDNVGEGITYQLLPTANYEMPISVAFAPGESSKSLSVTIEEGHGLTEGDYLLPIMLDKIEGKPFNVNERICYIHLEYKDILPYLNILLSAPDDNIVTASGYDQGANGNGNYLPYRLFDNAPTWTWRTHGSKAGTYNNPVDEPYNDPVYGQYVDIHVKNAGFNLSRKLDIFLQTNWSDCKPHVIRVYGKAVGSSDWVALTGEMEIGSKLRKPTTAEDSAIGTNTNQTVYKHSEVEQSYIDLQGMSIASIRIAILKTYKGKTFAEQTGIYDQTVKPAGTTGWPVTSISELKLYGK